MKRGFVLPEPVLELIAAVTDKSRGLRVTTKLTSF
jgi:hypothetical protein